MIERRINRSRKAKENIWRDKAMRLHNGKKSRNKEEGEGTIREERGLQEGRRA